MRKLSNEFKLILALFARTLSGPLRSKVKRKFGPLIHIFAILVSLNVHAQPYSRPEINCADYTRILSPGQCTYSTLGFEFDPVLVVEPNVAVTVFNNYNNSASLAGAVFSAGVTTVLWTVTDPIYLVDTCRSRITIVDDQVPLINCPGLGSTQAFYVGERGGNGALSKISMSGTRNIITVLPQADGVVLESPTSAIVSRFNGNGSTLVRVNLTTGMKTDLVSLGGYCQGLSLDGSGNIYVASEQLNKIQKVNLNTLAVTDILTGLSRPIDVVFENQSTILFSEYNQSRLRRYNLNTNTTTTVCSGLHGPTDIYNEGNGNVLIIEDGSNRISRVNLITGVSTLVINLGSGLPHGIAKDNLNNIYVTRYLSGDILKITPLNVLSTHATGLINPIFIVSTLNTTMNVQCPADVPLVNTSLITASDNCSVTITHVDDVISNQLCDNQYTLTRTYKATDPSGNSTTCAQTVIVNDTTRPIIICPMDINVSCGQNVQFSAFANDNCGSVNITYSHPPNSSFPPGSTIVTATATDLCGNNSSGQFTVNVNGLTPICSLVSSPNTNGPLLGGTTTNAIANQMFLGYGYQSMNITCSASGGGPFTYNWSGTGISGSGSSIVFTPLAGGNYPITCSATNSYGCKTNCSIIICVLDVRAPVSSPRNTNVYVCHIPHGIPGNTRPLSLNINAVQAHIANQAGHEYCRLGYCDQVCGFSKAGYTFETQNIYSGDEVHVLVYPNPSNGKFKLKLTSISEEPMVIKIIDFAGRLVYESSNPNINQEIEIGEEFIEGIYIANISQGTFSKTVKISKVK